MRTHTDTTTVRTCTYLSTYIHTYGHTVRTYHTYMLYEHTEHIYITDGHTYVHTVRPYRTYITYGNDIPWVHTVHTCRTCVQNIHTERTLHIHTYAYMHAYICLLWIVDWSQITTFQDRPHGPVWISLASGPSPPETCAHDQWAREPIAAELGTIGDLVRRP